MVSCGLRVGVVLVSCGGRGGVLVSCWCRAGVVLVSCWCRAGVVLVSCWCRAGSCPAAWAMTGAFICRGSNHCNRVVPGRDIASRTQCREETRHALQYFDLADP